MPAKKKQQQKKEDESIEALAAKVFGGDADDNSKQSNKALDAVSAARKAELEAFLYQFQREAAEHTRYQQIETSGLQHFVRDSNRTQDPGPQVELESIHTKWREVAPGKYIRCELFSAAMMEPLTKLFAEQLSEPYSIFTYEHFLMGWPDLSILLFGFEAGAAKAAPVDGTDKGTLIGGIVSSLKLKEPPMGPHRGYIAMLAVVPEWRGHRLGQYLVKATVEQMRRKRATEVCLETPTTNVRALKLYTEMGFAKHKYLTRYYLDGQDAVRLKLWFEVPRPN